MLLYIATFTYLTQNNIQKICILSVFQECPTIAHRDGGTYLKLANKIQKSLEEVISLIKTSIKCSTLLIGHFFVLK